MTTAPDTDTLAGLAAQITPGPWKSSLLMTDLHLEREARISVIKAHEYVGYAVWPDLGGKSVPMVAMTPMCSADNPHDARAIALAPELAAEVIALRAQTAKDKARIERLEAALRLLALRSESLVHAHQHGNGLEGWYNTVDGVDRAVTAARAALEDGE